MSEGLKRCPFCGGKAEVRAFTLTMQFAQCMECGAGTTSYETQEEAAIAWNKRWTLFSRLRKLVRVWLGDFLED